jgi:nanoRNase/pAp phosphatase (c-di-AMP/oligoRNAs hydrolase)
MNYETNTTIDAIAHALRGARRVLVTTHAKPDGDALGSVLAVIRACQAIGVAAEGWVVDPCEGNLRSFEGSTPVRHVNPRAPEMPAGDFDLAVVVDTGAWTQLEALPRGCARCMRRSLVSTITRAATTSRRGAWSTRRAARAPRCSHA